MTAGTPVLPAVPAMPRRGAMVGWSAHLVTTITGDVGPPLRLLGDAGVWTDGPLNDATSGQVKIPLAELREFDRHWWSPWSGSVLVCFDAHPLVLGPILNLPEQAAGGVMLKFGGLWSLLDCRYVTADDYGTGQGVDLAASTVSYAGPTLGQIAVDLVRKSMLRPNGRFPFSVNAPFEPGSGRVRNYEGHNVTNNSVGKRLREITEVIGGPDIAFRPAWTNASRTQVEWVMYHGTEGMPEIGQQRVPVLDMTAPKGRFTEPQIKAEGTRFDRAYMTGQGEGETTEVVIVSKQAADLGRYEPFLEVAVGDGQATDEHGLLESRGQAVITATDIIQVTTNVRASDPAMPVWTWHTGDEMIVRIGDKWWPQLDPGTYRMRVLSRSGTFATDTVKIEFQPEQLLASG